jgi:hypothetical protein
VELVRTSGRSGQSLGGAGLFDRTAARLAPPRAAGVPFGITTTLTRDGADDLPWLIDVAIAPADFGAPTSRVRNATVGRFRPASECARAGGTPALAFRPGSSYLRVIRARRIAGRSDAGL